MTNQFHEFYHQQLNKDQQKAVNQKNGVLLVTAGAGSGKTRVITSRIINLITNENVHPASIVALTFTNKAAKEMQDRIIQFLGKLPFMPFIGTFHSYCLYLLKRHVKLLEHETFSIMDGNDQQKLIGKLIKRFHLEKQTTARQLAFHISKYKNSLLSTDAEHTYIEPLVSQIYQAYEKEKSLSKCFDFDDLLLETLKLFKKNKDLKKEHQEFIRHVLVDEYQDTNVVQHNLLKQMALQSKKCVIDSLCVVGDEDQSIYSWRGATITNIMNFKKDFPKVKTITIAQNYRSVQPILDVANIVIQNNKNRNPKQLWSEKTGKNRIRKITCVSGYQEAEVITLLAKTVLRKKKRPSIAVLYRAHYQSRILEEALLRHAIAYRIIGGIQFYERAEIKDILAYLRVIVNPFDRISVSRVINTPSRGLGDKFQELLFERWANEPFLTIFDLCKKLINEKAVTGIKLESLKKVLSHFEGLKSTDSPTKTIDQLIQKIGYLQYLKKSHDSQEASDKRDNIKELLQAVQFVEKKGTKSISAFLDDVTLMQEKMHNKDAKDEHVQLMTLHAAKGLEFDTVIVVGLEEGILPSSRSLTENDTAEEECRLFYVGITRARERLVLSHARYRHTFGSMEHKSPSRFLDGLSETLVPHEDLSYTKEHQIGNLFAQWLNIPSPGPARPSVMTFNLPQFLSKDPPIKRTPRTPSKRLSSSQWKKHSPVKHTKFGVGVIKNIERKGPKKIYITATFKSGTKKIDAQYLVRV